MIQPSKSRSEHVVEARAPLQRVWADGGFAMTVQMPPLVSLQLSAGFTQIATQLVGFDAVLLADAPDGAVALSSTASAVLFQRAGLSPIAQLSGRDRNRLALQGDILGLGALRIPTLLIDTRPVDRTSLGKNPDARLVTDLDGPALLATAARLRDEARFVSGANIKTPPVFSLGALIDLNAPLSEEQLVSAQFLVTAPLADPRHLLDLLVSLQRDHADFLHSRPVLVSLPFPCVRGSRPEQVITAQDAWQDCLSMLHALQQCGAVRGCNLLLQQLSDLELLHQGASSGLRILERPE